MSTVRFAFDVGEQVEFGPNLKGKVVLVRWDGFKRDYFVQYWDDDKELLKLWLDETELARPEQ